MSYDKLNKFNKAVNKLDKRKKTIVIYRLDYEPLETIGRKLKLTTPRIYQLEQEAWRLIEDEINSEYKKRPESVLTLFLDGKINHRVYSVLNRNWIRTTDKIRKMSEQQLASIDKIGFKQAQKLKLIAN